MERLFVDTSAWFAYVNSADPAHRPVVELLSGFGGRLLTSNYVFDETITLCRRRLGHDVAARVGEVLRDADVTDLLRVGGDDEQAAWQLFLDRPDKDYSFTDCTSFVLLRKLEVQRVAALDDDFRREGFTVLPV